MKKSIEIMIVIAAIIGGLYVGGWLMLIQPIIECCKAFDAGTLTGLMVGMSALKCLFATAIGSIIIYVGTFLGLWLCD